MLSKIVDRNNTSFPKEIFEALKKIKIVEGDPLRYHQRIVFDYLIGANVRGILAYQKMGSGKTIIAVSSAVELLSTEYRVVFLAGKGLHANFKKDINKFHEISEDFRSKYPDVEEFKDSINFISMNASNMLKQFKDKLSESLIHEESGLQNLDKVFLIVDEAHNFFNSISNESKNAIGLYDMIMNTNNMKILFLTGSPIINHPFESALCFNMLASKIKGAPLFAANFGEFSKNFIQDPDALNLDSGKSAIPTIKNADKFSDRIFGLVSYFGADSPEQLSLFPKEYQTVISIVPMSVEQYAQYNVVRDQEIKESSRTGLFNLSKKFGKPSGVSSTYRVNSRQVSNIAYPPTAGSIEKEEGRVRVSRDFASLTDDDMKNLSVWSTKIKRILTNISIHMPQGILDEIKPGKKYLDAMIKKRREINGEWNIGIGKGFVYSQFLDSGVNVLGRALEAYGFVQINNYDDILEYGSRPKKMGSYSTISGKMDADIRAEIIRAYNSPENVNGEIISLLLVTSTGAEGIDLKEGRHGHIMEPYWNYSRIAQVMARLIRAGSHMRLPESERTVQFYIYLSDYPTNLERENLEPTTDFVLYYGSIQQQLMINSFNKVIIASSIDCMIHYDNNECRMCSPTGKILWRTGPGDLKIPSPCEPLVEKKIQVKTILIGDSDKEYAYTIDNGRIHLFEHLVEIDGYKEIFPDHKQYEIIYKSVLNKEKMKD